MNGCILAYFGLWRRACTHEHTNTSQVTYMSLDIEHGTVAQVLMTCAGYMSRYENLRVNVCVMIPCGPSSTSGEGKVHSKVEQRVNSTIRQT